MTQAGSLWSRRRAAVAAEAEAERALREDMAHREAQADKTDAEILAELDLPDPENLKMGDDFAAFMSKAVPEHLRKKALRQLWRSNPVLACVDGLNDYDEDYLTGSFGNDPIKTTYQVGKGLMAHVLEMERQENVATEADDAAPENEEEIVVATVESEPVIDEPLSDEADESEAEPYRPRRMAFQFEGEQA